MEGKPFWISGKSVGYLRIVFNQLLIIFYSLLIKEIFANNGVSNINYTGNSPKVTNRHLHQRTSFYEVAELIRI